MKNKEIEELLNMLKKCAREDKATLKLNEIACKTILSYIEQLEKENKILRENAEHNDKVVDKVNWEINILKHNRDKAIEYMQDFIFEPLLVQEDRKLIMFNENLRNFENILKGGSDE